MNNFYRKFLIPLFFLSISHLAIVASGGRPAVEQIQVKDLIPHAKAAAGKQAQASNGTLSPELISYLNYNLKPEPSAHPTQQKKAGSGNPISIDQKIAEAQKSISVFEKSLKKAKTDSAKATLSKKLAEKQEVLEQLQSMKKFAEPAPTALDLNLSVQPVLNDLTLPENSILPVVESASVVQPTPSFVNIQAKINKPIESYILESAKALQNTRISPEVINEITPIYTIALINTRSDMFGRPNKVETTEMGLKLDWNTDKPTGAQKIVAGLDVINDFPNKNLNASYFAPGKEMPDYVAALKAIFPKIPDQLLTQSVATILQAAQSGQPGKLWGKHITLTPEQVAKDLGWPDRLNNNGNLAEPPTAQQKVYAMLDGIQKTLEQNEAGPTSISMVNQIARSVVSAPEKVYGLGQSVYNAGQKASELISLVKELQADPTNATIQKITPLIQDWLRSDNSSGKPLTKESKDQLSSLLETATGLKVDLNKPAENIAQQIKTIAKEKAADAIVKVFDIKPEDDVSLVTPQSKNATIENQDASITAIKTMKSSKTHGFVYTTLRASARKMQRTPEAVKNLIKSTIDAFARFMNFSKEETTTLHETINIDKECEQLENDPNSWVNAQKKADFNYKFDLWVQSFTYRLATIVNSKAAKNIELRYINENISDPLAPKLTIAYDTSTNIIRYIKVDYQGNQYTVKPTENTSVENIITCQIPLYPKPVQQSLLQKSQTNAYNKFVAQTAGNGLQQSQVEQILPGVGKTAQDALTAKPNGPDKFITLMYDTLNNTIKTQETKVLTSTIDKHSAQVITTATYHKNAENPDLKIAITDNHSDLFFPKLTLDYTPGQTPKNLGTLTSLTLEHQAKTGFKETVDFHAKPENIKMSKDKQSFIITANIVDRPAFAPLNRADQAHQNIVHATQDAAPKLINNIIKGFAAGETGGTLQHQYEQPFNALGQGLVDATKFGQSPERLGIDTAVIKFTPSTNIIELQITTTMSRGELRTKTLRYQV